MVTRTTGQTLCGQMWQMCEDILCHFLFSGSIVLSGLCSILQIRMFLQRSIPFPFRPFTPIRTQPNRKVGVFIAEETRMSIVFSNSQFLCLPVTQNAENCTTIAATKLPPWPTGMPQDITVRLNVASHHNVDQVPQGPWGSFTLDVLFMCTVYIAFMCLQLQINIELTIDLKLSVHIN